MGKNAHIFPQGQGQGGDPVVQELPVFQPARVEVKDFYSVGPAAAPAGDLYGRDDAAKSDRLITALQGQFHSGPQLQRLTLIQEESHIVLCHQRGDTLVFGLTGGHPHRLGIVHLDSLPVAVPSVHQKQGHDEEIEVADDPEEQDQQTDRLHCLENNYYPDNARQREGDQDQERNHGTGIPGPLSALCGLVGHLEGGEGKAQGLLQNRDQQMGHDTGLVDTAPFSGNRVFAGNPQGQIL